MRNVSKAEVNNGNCKKPQNQGKASEQIIKEMIKCKSC